MQIVIEKGIPIPAPGGKTKPLSEFTKTIMSMEVGDSYLVPNGTRFTVRHVYVARVKGWKFQTRKVGDQIRVWRVA